MGKLGHLHLLEAFFEKIITVQSVKEEVLDRTAPEYPLLIDAFSTWLTVYNNVHTPLSKRLIEMGLHQGEADVLALAYNTKINEKDSITIIDDLAARDVARALGLRVTGTIGIILRARKRGIISKEESITKINYLINETPFRLSTKLYSKIIDELNG